MNPVTSNVLYIYRCSRRVLISWRSDAGGGWECRSAPRGWHPGLTAGRPAGAGAGDADAGDPPPLRSGLGWIVGIPAGEGWVSQEWDDRRGVLL
jgi:hypothetical protein